jgi:hypothetical protein
MKKLKEQELELTEQELEIIIKALEQSVFLKQGYVYNALRRRGSGLISTTNSEINTLNKMIELLKVIKTN